MKLKNFLFISLFLNLFFLNYLSAMKDDFYIPTYSRYLEKKISEKSTLDSAMESLEYLKKYNSFLVDLFGYKNSNAKVLNKDNATLELRKNFKLHYLNYSKFLFLVNNIKNNKLEALLNNYDLYLDSINFLLIKRFDLYKVNDFLFTMTYLFKFVNKLSDFDLKINYTFKIGDFIERFIFKKDKLIAINNLKETKQMHSKKYKRSKKIIENEMHELFLEIGNFEKEIKIKNLKKFNIVKLY